MGHNNAVSGHPISTSFSQADDWSTDPRVLGRHNRSRQRRQKLVRPFVYIKIVQPKIPQVHELYK